MDTKQEPTSFFLTRGQEQPSLEYGPQRLHYIYSVGIPQAYLTLFSILQGFIFTLVLANIPVPKDTEWSLIWNLIVQNYFYLPYIISLGVLILTWLHQISITLTGGWPNTFFQISLVVGLALFETIAVQNIRTISIWLIFLGCTSVLGGAMLIRTGKIHHSDDFDPHPAFQKFGEALKKWEIMRGKQYIIIGFTLIIITLIRFISIYTFHYFSFFFNIIFPWSIYMLIIIFLYFMVLSRLMRNRSYREIRNTMYNSTDIIISHGIARYKKNSSTIPQAAYFKDDNSKVNYKNTSHNLLILLALSNMLIIILLSIVHKIFSKRHR